MSTVRRSLSLMGMAVLLVLPMTAVAASVPTPGDVKEKAASTVGTVSQVLSPGTQQDAAQSPRPSASGEAADVSVGGKPIASAGETSASSGSGEATALSVTGHRVSSARSRGAGEASTHVLGPLCGAGNGVVCVGLLYAAASGHGTETRADASVLFACVGGGGGAWNGTCNGPVGAEVLGSHSQTSASASGARSSLAWACLGGRSEEGCRGLGVELIHARASGGPQASSESGLLTVQGKGRTVLEISPRVSFAFPKGCSADPGSGFCLTLSDAKAIGDEGAAAEAVRLIVIRSEDVPSGELLAVALSEALAVGPGEELADEPAAPSPGDVAAGSGEGSGSRPGGGAVLGAAAGRSEGGASSSLAFTGGQVIPAAVAAFGLIVAGAGALLTARRQRRAAP